MQTMKEDALQIIHQSIAAVMPQTAVEKALKEKTFPGDVVVVAIGKAAWTMAQAASKLLAGSMKKGIIITKYHHSQGEIPGFAIYEGGHPLLDQNSIDATQKVLEAVNGLTPEDTVVFLISGGGSALFEKPLEGISLEDIHHITQQLLYCGADIVEINTIRKHLSQVKGGRFAQICQPAHVFSVVLSDVVGDRLDSIASGPACPDASTSQEAFAILEKYQLTVPAHIKKALEQETPKALENVETVITGSVCQLCTSAANSAEALGYHPVLLTTELGCEAKEAGLFLGAMASSIQSGQVKSTFPLPCALIAGGETVVHLTGKGKGGRNQELALSAARAIAGLENVVIAAVGSDGTDGPTDAAGGIVDGQTKHTLQNSGISIDEILQQNNAFYALEKADGLIITGPTGTNVNDLYFVLIK